MPIKNPSTSLRTGIIPGQRIARAKLQRARELRQAMTVAEKALWQELRANKSGIHFGRQQIIAGFIVDFYCYKADLVIEVDGDIHGLQQDEDARRETVLKGMGFTIVRFRNEDVIQHLPGVVRKIKKPYFALIILRIFPDNIRFSKSALPRNVPHVFCLHNLRILI